MIARYLYDRPRILVLVLIVLVAVGGAALVTLPRLEDPVLTKRIALVNAAWPGASAASVERLVAIPIEQAVESIPEVEEVRSICRDGLVTTVLKLRDEATDAEAIWRRVADRIDETAAALPETTVPPELAVFPLRAYASIVALLPNEDRSPLGIAGSADGLRQALLAIEGTERVDLFGQPVAELAVEPTPEQLVDAGLSIASLAAQIDAALTERPGGSLAGSGGRFTLEARSPLSAIERVRAIRVQTGGGSRSVGEIASVAAQAEADRPDIAIVDGRDAIVIASLFDDRSRVDAWAEQVDAVLADIDGDFTLVRLFSQRDHVAARMRTLAQNLAMSVAAVSAVVLLMMGWRSMLVVAVSLPLSALAVLGAMRALGIPIHQMSVTGLIVALGLLIDATIVVVDELQRRLERGQSPVAAIRAAVRLLTVPLVGSTLTTALAFLPIATLPGPPGEFVGTIATSVILSITASLLLALTVVPAMMGRFGSGPATDGASPSLVRSTLDRGLHLPRVSQAYRSLLRWLLRYPIVTMALTVAGPIAGFALLPLLPVQFFPSSDRGQIQVEIERPAGSTIAQTRVAVQTVSDVIDATDGIERQTWFIGRSAPTFFYNIVPRRREAPGYAQAFVDLQPGQNARSLVRTLQTSLDAAETGSRVVVRQIAQGPPYDAPVEVRLLGDDVDVLTRLGDQVRSILSGTPHVVHTRSDLSDAAPRLALSLAEPGSSPLTESQLNGLLYTNLVGADAGQIVTDTGRLPVRARLRLESDDPLAQVMAMPAGSPIPAAPGRPPRPAPTLGAITDLRLASDGGSILRIDGSRAAEVKAYITAGVLPSVVTDALAERLDEANFRLPGGYTMSLGGETEQRSRAVSKLIANAVTLFALMLLCLVASFQSFRCAMLIAVVGGLSAGLGPLALAGFGYPFGFMAVVGTMGLVGVAINDSIIVLTQIRQRLPSRSPSDEASSANADSLDSLVDVVVDATRHVLATTLTTIVGFLPLVLGGGGFWPPLAISIAGGVGGATLLALALVPASYRLLWQRGW